MSNEEQTGSTDSHIQGIGRVIQMKTWLYLIAGFSSLTLIAVIMGLLLVQFYQNRPVNLTKVTGYLADAVEKNLHELYIAENSLERSVPERRQDGIHYWYFYRFDVALPPQLSAEGMEKLLRREMAEFDVDIIPLPVSGSETRWRLVFGELEFAEIVLESSTDIVSYRQDLRQTSQSIADEFRAMLLRHGISTDKIQQIGPLEQEDELFQWYVTNFEALLPADNSLDTFWEDADNLADRFNVHALLEETASGIFLMRFSLSDRIQVEAVMHYMGDVLNDEEDADLITEPEVLPYEEAGDLPAGTDGGEEGEEEGTGGADIDSTEQPESVILPSPEQLPLESEYIDLHENGVAPAVKVATPGEKPRVAIILDDGGYGGAHNEKILNLSNKLTLAILPNTPLGESIANQGAALGFEIMLHMPMQNNNEGNHVFPGQIEVDMEADKIRELTLDALSQIPHVVGVNNHTGSMYTSDPDAMETFLEIIKEKGLYFLDSRTTASSRAYEIARSKQIPTASRDIFLDHNNDPEQIRVQFIAMIELAKSRGSAIAIGHFRPHTVDVLEAMLPILDEEEIELIHVSELMH